MSTTQFKFECGDLVRDKVTGFKGTIICKTIYLNGCIRYGLQPKVGKETEKVPDQYYMDEQQLELIKSKNVSVEAKKTGGDRKNPKENRIKNDYKY